MPTYLINSLGTALLTVVFTVFLTALAGYGLARFPIPFKEPLFVLMLLALIIPYQALLTPLFLMFSDLGLTNSLVGLAIVHTAIQFPFSLYVMRNSFEAVPQGAGGGGDDRRCRFAADPAADLPPRRRPGDHHGRPVRVHHVVERVPRRPRDDDRRGQVHPPADPRQLAHGERARGHRFRDAAGRDHDLDRPVCRRVPAAAALLRVRAAHGSGEVDSRLALPVAPSRGRSAAARSRRGDEITGGEWATASAGQLRRDARPLSGVDGATRLDRPTSRASPLARPAITRGWCSPTPTSTS